jgi:hypothetical protein
LSVITINQHGDLVACKGFELFVCHKDIIHFLKP